MVEPMRDVRSRFDHLRGWWRDLSSEVAQLPTTLQQMREGAANFQLVGQRLAESSTALEELTRLYGKTLRQTVRRSTEAAESLRSQIDRLSEGAVAPDTLASAASELQRTVESLAAMNPFWRTGEHGTRRR
jgi:DNA repair ATPase RecN